MIADNSNAPLAHYSWSLSRLVVFNVVIPTPVMAFIMKSNWLTCLGFPPLIDSLICQQLPLDASRSLSMLVSVSEDVNETVVAYLLGSILNRTHNLTDKDEELAKVAKLNKYKQCSLHDFFHTAVNRFPLD